MGYLDSVVSWLFFLLCQLLTGANMKYEYILFSPWILQSPVLVFDIHTQS